MKIACLQLNPTLGLVEENITIVKTGKALLVAHSPANVQAGNAVNTVEQLGDYLKKAGY
jgi:profilin